MLGTPQLVNLFQIIVSISAVIFFFMSLRFNKAIPHLMMTHNVLVAVSNCIMLRASFSLGVNMIQRSLVIILSSVFVIINVQACIIECWMRKSAYLCVVAALFAFLNGFELYNLLEGPVITTITALILYYQLDKRKKIDFLERYQNDKKISGLLHLFDSALPSSVAIVSQNLVQGQHLSIQFSNQAFKRQFLEPTSEKQLDNIEQDITHDCMLNQILNITVQQDQGLNQNQKNFSKSNSVQEQIQQKLTLNHVLLQIMQQTEPFDHISLTNCRYQSAAGLGQSEERILDIAIADCPAFESKETKNVMVVITDITERQRVADLNHLNQYKDVVLASVTHDLKTPLNSIICQSENALLSNDLQTIKQNVKIIERNAKMLIHQVYDILDYSYYLQNNKIRVQKQYFRISDLIQDVRDLFMQQAQIKNLDFKIQVNIEQADNLFVCSDKTRLLQVLINLLSNAFKFTFKGSVELLVEQESQQAIQLLRFSVRDTGIGMTQEQLKSIFRFFTTFDKKKGYGLGLAFSQRIVACLGPSQYIKVDSVKEQGSCFSFTIFQNVSAFRRQTAMQREIIDQIQPESPAASPLRNRILSAALNNCKEKLHFEIQIQQQQQQEEEEEWCEYSSESQLDIQEVKSAQNIFLECFEKLSQSNIAKEQSKILLVDDEAFNHSAFSGVFKRCFNDLQIESAFNGSEAIERVMLSARNEVPQEQRYLCVVTDQQMPLMNGTQFCQIVRQKIAEGQIYDLPVIISSANNSQQDLQLYREAGAIGFLEKPVNREKLFTIITQLRTRSRKLSNTQRGGK